MADRQDTLHKLEILQNICIARATRKDFDRDEYREIRADLLKNPVVADRLPQFVQTSRTLDELWMYMQRKANNYYDRTKHIEESFYPLIDQLSRGVSAADLSIEETLERLNAEAVQSVWQKALDRRITDSEGAITAARTLLETVCKHILDDADISYAPGADLPLLYRSCAGVLSISPSPHTEQYLRQMLSGCMSVVHGLSSLRNSASDAHGQGRNAVKLKEQHARLAVNLAGSMATFLVETWEDCRS